MSGYAEGNTYIINEFDDGLQSLLPELTHEIRLQQQLQTGYIDLWITSPGGDWHVFKHILELVEIAKRSGVIVRTIVPSIAYSAGSMLAIVGSPGHRYIARDAEHLVHYGSVGVTEESTPLQSARANAWKNQSFKQVVKHYNTYANIPNIEHHISDDLFFIPANKCKQWKLADKYIEQLEL